MHTHLPGCTTAAGLVNAIRIHKVRPRSCDQIQWTDRRQLQQTSPCCGRRPTARKTRERSHFQTNRQTPGRPEPACLPATRETDLAKTRGPKLQPGTCINHLIARPKSDSVAYRYEQPQVDKPLGWDFKLVVCAARTPDCLTINFGGSSVAKTNLCRCSGEAPEFTYNQRALESAASITQRVDVTRFLTAGYSSADAQSDTGRIADQFIQEPPCYRQVGVVQPAVVIVASGRGSS